MFLYGDKLHPTLLDHREAVEKWAKRRHSNTHSELGSLDLWNLFSTCDGNFTIVVLTKALPVANSTMIATGTAKRRPSDTHNFSTGFNIALFRALDNTTCIV